jgi:hypothetical protein
MIESWKKYPTVFRLRVVVEAARIGLTAYRTSLWRGAYGICPG